MQFRSVEGKIAVLILNMAKTNSTIISIYEPTEVAEQAKIDRFDDKLEKPASKKRDKIILLCDAKRN